MPESPVASVERLPQAVVVHVMAEELRKDQVDAGCAAIDAALRAAPSLPFILDMGHVTFAGSLALGMLAGLSQEFRTRNQPLIFVSLQTYVRQSVEVTRIRTIMSVMDDVSAALRSLGGAA